MADNEEKTRGYWEFVFSRWYFWVVLVIGVLANIEYVFLSIYNMMEYPTDFFSMFIALAFMTLFAPTIAYFINKDLERTKKRTIDQNRKL